MNYGILRPADRADSQKRNEFPNFRPTNRFSDQFESPEQQAYTLYNLGLPFHWSYLRNGIFVASYTADEDMTIRSVVKNP
jgi:hypothetical protein